MREDYEGGLPTYTKKLWEDIKLAMARFTYFASLDETEIREACLLGKILSFHNNETVFGDGVGISTFVYFILSGQCKLIEALNVSSRRVLSRTNFKLHKSKIPLPKIKSPSHSENHPQRQQYPRGQSISVQKNSINLDAKVNLEEEPRLTSIRSVVNQKTVKVQPKAADNDSPVTTYFMQVCLMNQGACFNLGESFDNRRMVATDDVECLLLPKHWLWNKKTAYIWERVRHYLETKIPSTERVYESFVTNFHWREYKAKILKEILDSKRSKTNTTIHDVPYSVRIYKDRV